jgi:hypothetical protein
MGMAALVATQTLKLERIYVSDSVSNCVVRRVQ